MNDATRSTSGYLEAIAREVMAELGRAPSRVIADVFIARISRDPDAVHLLLALAEQGAMQVARNAFRRKYRGEPFARSNGREYVLVRHFDERDYLGAIELRHQQLGALERSIQRLDTEARRRLGRRALAWLERARRTA